MQLLTIKQSLKTIKLIYQAGAKLDERIHQVGCSGLSHFLETGDLTALTELTHAMPKSSRGNALKYWVTKHANVKWNTKAYAGAGGWVIKKKGSERDVQLQDAIDNPFWNKEDKESAAFTDIHKLIASVKSRIAKALDDGKVLPEEEVYAAQVLNSLPS